MVDTLPRREFVSPNPIRPSVDPSEIGSARGLNLVLDEQAKTQNRAAGKAAAGDSWLPWELMTQTEKSPRFTLGSEGKFWHPEYGILKAKYVQFGTLSVAPAIGSPVGVESNQPNPWRVTDDRTKSSGNLVVGLAAPYEFFESESYGWAVIEGVSLTSVTLSAATLLGDALAWTETGKLGRVGVGSEVSVGRALANGTSELAPAQIRVIIGQGTSNSQVIPDYPTWPEIDDALLNIDRQWAQAEFELSYLRRVVATITENSAELSLTEILNATMNFSNLAGTAADEALRALGVTAIKLEATNSLYEQTRVWRDETGYYARSTRVQSDTAKLSSDNSAASAFAAAISASTAETGASAAGIYASAALTSATNAATSESNSASSASNAATFAGQASTSETNAAGSAAAAYASQVITSQVGAGSLLTNPVFSGYIIPTGRPDYWDAWSGAPTFSRGTPGIDGPYFMSMTSAAGDQGIQTDSIRSPGLAKLTPGYYVLEADVRVLSGGSWLGSGLFVNAFSASNSVVSSASINFATDVTIEQTTAAYNANYIAKWRKLIRLTGAVDHAVVYMMNGWTGFTASPPARILEWHKASIRPASQAEIDGNQALQDAATAYAAVVIEASTRAGEVSTLNAKYGVKVIAGDSFAGFELNAGTGLIPYFKIEADQFLVKTATTSQNLIEATGDKIAFGTDIYIGSYKIIMDTGTVMQVQGLGFGSTNQFIEWFGPTMAVSAMTESNGITWKKLDGSAYFGGTLSAGILRNATTNTTIADNLTVDLGPFGSNGDPKTIVVSMEYSYLQRANAGTGGIGSFSPGSIAVTYNGASIGSLTVNETLRDVHVDGDPSVKDVMRWKCAASGTLTSSDTSLTGNIIEAILAFTPAAITGSGLTAPEITQFLSIISTET